MSGVRQRVLSIQDFVQPSEQPELHVPGHDHPAPSEPSARRGKRAQTQDDDGFLHQLHIEFVNVYNRVLIVFIFLSPLIFWSQVHVRVRVCTRRMKAKDITFYQYYYYCCDNITLRRIRPHLVADDVISPEN